MEILLLIFGASSSNVVIDSTGVLGTDGLLDHDRLDLDVLYVVFLSWGLLCSRSLCFLLLGLRVVAFNGEPGRVGHARLGFPYSLAIKGSSSLVSCSRIRHDSVWAPLVPSHLCTTPQPGHPPVSPYLSKSFDFR